MARRGNAHPPEVKAEALRLHLAGKTIAEIGRALNVPYWTVKGWVFQWAPEHSPESRQLYARTREELSNLVYAAIVETIQAIRARATATADRDWIQKQTADSLAQLDATQWQFVVRVLGSFRPPEGDPGSPAELSSPEHPGNGAVDPSA